MTRYFHPALVAIFALSALLIVDASSAKQSAHCLVDLEDVDPDDVGDGHTTRETTYTKLHNGINYTCVSGCDHCCATESSCCDHTKDSSDGKDSGAGSGVGCMEDERGNVAESNCGFKMVCCTDEALLPSGDCPALLGGRVILMLLLVAVCLASIGICIGVSLCYKKRCCCWATYPKTLDNFPVSNSAPAVVVGQPVMGVAVVEAPMKQCEKVVPSDTTE